MTVLPDSNLIVTGRHGTYKINYQTGDSIWSNTVRGRAIWPMKDSTLIVEDGTLNKMTYNGDSIWAQNLNISVNQGLVLNSIVELDGGCIAALGSRVTSIGSTTTYEPFFAYFDSSFDFPVNAGIQDLQSPYTVTVTPNPVSTQATLSYTNEQHEQVEFKLYDITGKVVQQEETNASHVIIANKNMSGLFIYELRFKDGVVVRGKVMMAP